MARPDQGGGSPPKKKRNRAQPSAPGYIRPGTTSPGRTPPRGPTAPARSAPNQSGPAPTRSAVTKASRPRKAATVRSRLEQRAATARAQAERRRVREQREERLRQPYGRGIAPTYDEVARTATLLDAPGLGLVATQRVAPRRSGMQKALGDLRRARQAMLTRSQWVNVYGSTEGYADYLRHVAKAREIPVGMLKSVPKPGLAPARVRRLRNTELAEITRLVGKIPRQVLVETFGEGAIPVYVNWRRALRGLDRDALPVVSQMVRLAAEYDGERTRYSMSARASITDPDPDYFDCSSFVNWLYAKASGVAPAGNGTTQEWYYTDRARTVPLSDIRPGDVILWGPSGDGSSVPVPGGSSHMGMYVGNGLFVHSSSSNDGVYFSPLDEYLNWKPNPTVRRVIRG